MDHIARRIAKLPPEQRAKLESCLFDAPCPADTLSRRARTDKPPPLSFAQERLWFLEQLQPGTPTYNLPLMLPLNGKVNARAVEGAINDVVGRHDILRSTIGLLEGRPVQIIASTWAVPVRQIVLPDRPATLLEVIRSEVMQPFDLSVGPLLRATIVPVSDTVSSLLVVMHHIISDGWSGAIFAKEFAASYAARCAGQTATLPSLAIQYADYAEWQRICLAGRRGSALFDYWLQKLAGAPQILRLASGSHSLLGDAAGATHVAPLASGSAAVWALARAENATSFIVLISAFFALLHRFSGQDDILVGTPVANRDRIELEPLIGLFVNTLPLRSRIGPLTSLRALVRQTRSTVLDAHANKDLPFEQLVSRLVSTRDATRPPLVQVLFAVENVPAGIQQMDDRAARPAPGDDTSYVETTTPVSKVVAPKAKFDLTLTVLDTGHGLSGVWDYSTGVFDKTTIARLAHSYDVLLSASLAAPDQQIARLPLLEPDERARLIRAPDETACHVTSLPSTLYELVAAQAACTPNAIALVSGEASFSFAELIGWVNTLAAQLNQQGVGPGGRIGVCISRSPQMIVGLLAVLRLGSAYVPLDPDYPNDRLAYMAADADLVLILTEQVHYKRLLAATAAAPVPLYLVNTSSHSAESTGPAELSLAAAKPDDIAYVIYTSGSTGRPKGVMISHRAIVNQMRWFLATWPLSPSDRVLQRTSLSFDASVWEIFAPLMSGAGLVLSRHDVGGFTSIGMEIRQHGVTVLQLVPTLLRILLEHGSLDGCPSLRVLFCGGEALPSRLVKRVMAIGGATLVNLYGPTEASINATFHVVSGEIAEEIVPIGRPVANMHVYVLDNGMEPVPPGAIGELYLGGVGLARGYIGKPNLTAAAFVPDPFGTESGGRLYRTGDLVCYRPDGLLEFRGRHDHQVKIRGFRVELAETEMALISLPEIAAAVVQAQDDRLVAWVVPTENAILFLEQLRASLCGVLPEYMVPALYIPIASIPLLPNGKVNLAALPRAGVGRVDPDVRAEPQTETERLLALMWETLLGTGPLGLHDDFFVLGGHSLLAVQISSRVQDRFGVALPLRQIFDTPTIAALSSYIDDAVNTALLPAKSSGESMSFSKTERQRLVEQIDQIPEDQLDALLLALTEDVGHGADAAFARGV